MAQPANAARSRQLADSYFPSNFIIASGIARTCSDIFRCYLVDAFEVVCTQHDIERLHVFA